uniref:Cyclin B3 n=1 Tax=Hydatigena taeniaeformis TaxID=6205 RepID=A0A0R3WNV0_HYDTA
LKVEPPTEFVFPPQPVKKCVYSTVFKTEPTTEVILPPQPVKKCAGSAVFKAEPTAEVMVASPAVKECSGSSECALSSKSVKSCPCSIEDEELTDGLQALFKLFRALKSK